MRFIYFSYDEFFLRYIKKKGSICIPHWNLVVFRKQGLKGNGSQLIQKYKLNLTSLKRHGRRNHLFSSGSYGIIDKLCEEEATTNLLLLEMGSKQLATSSFLVAEIMKLGSLWSH